MRIPAPPATAAAATRPTVTDANLLLGRYDPDRFAGGRLALHRDRAEAAMARDVAEPQGIDVATAALGVVEIVDEAMANAARVHAIEAGTALEGRTLIAFGGGGPVHAARVAEKIGIDAVLVPPGAGVGSAIGFLRAPVAYEVVRSLYQRLASPRPRVASMRCSRRCGAEARGDRRARRAGPAGGGGAGRLHALCRAGARDRGRRCRRAP
ncbi:MAG: hydantoinase/oxoprolinase family protein [Acetobacteraceae bacterium]|nr:hydantoinase/oxoprolinase family protein [Acetobacteraceae bacterium]